MPRSEWPDPEPGTWSLDGGCKAVVRGEDVVRVGDAILIAAPDSQSSQGFWLGHVSSIRAPSKVTFCFCYGIDFNPPNELKEIQEIGGHEWQTNEVILSDWSHTINVAHVIASASTPPYLVRPLFLLAVFGRVFHLCVFDLCFRQRPRFALGFRSPRLLPRLASTNIGATSCTASHPRR